MRILDLFCGAGGAGMGYHQAFPDAQIVGVDIAPQPNYPFMFIQGDALAFPTDGYDLIHASPPCQAYSVITPDKTIHPELINPIRQRINHGPYVIENVPGSPMDSMLMLCGSMFGLQVQRHRYFEHNLGLIMSPACNHHEWADGFAWGIYGHAHGDNPGSQGGTPRHIYKNLTHAQELMQMPWVTKTRGITEAIPPAYTEYIGRQWVTA